MKLTTVKASSLLTVLCLSAALITSCGKKPETTTDTTSSSTTTTTTPAATTPAATTPAATTPAATTPAATTPASGAGAPLSAAEKTQLTPVKTSLVMANTAVKTGDMTKAKAQFDKFTTAWTTVGPMVEAKAGANYPMISSGIEMVKTAMSGATPDKAKAGEGLTTTIKAIDAVMNKK